MSLWMEQSLRHCPRPMCMIHTYSVHSSYSSHQLFPHISQSMTPILHPCYLTLRGIHHSRSLCPWNCLLASFDSTSLSTWYCCYWPISESTCPNLTWHAPPQEMEPPSSQLLKTEINAGIDLVVSLHPPLLYSMYYLILSFSPKKYGANLFTFQFHC